MLYIKDIHHVSIICADYEKSKRFYIEILGGEIIQETFREDRQSYKLDIRIGNTGQIELFSFPNPPKRPTRPEAQGLRHLAFAVYDIEESIEHLRGFGIEPEEVRIDELTDRKYTFFQDPDNLPLELYEVISED